MRPSALTMIKAIAAAGKLKGSPDYMTKTQIVKGCQRWLAERRKVIEPKGGK